MTPANAAQPAETEKAEGDPDTTQKQEGGAVEAPDATELVAEIGATMAKSLGELMQKELVVRDERLAALEAAVKALGESVEERVEQRLRDLPQVVKVAPTQVEATVAADKARKGLTFGRTTDDASAFAQKLVGDIAGVVEQAVKGAKYEA